MNSFLIALFELLNREFSYAVLRNYEMLPDHNPSRDIDLLIPEKEVKRLKPQLRKLIAKHNCRILYTNEDNQFLTIVLADAAYELFQLDLQYNFAWMGIDLLDENEVLKTRLFNGRVYHLNELYTFLPKYLYSRILGAPYPEKYAEIRSRAVETAGEELDRILYDLSLRAGSLDYWDKTGKWNLRFRAFLTALKHSPLQAVRRMVSFLWFYFIMLFIRRGLLISFSGPDGCGKTTVIELLRERLNVNPPQLFHFRPTLLPNLSEVGAKAGVVKEVDRNFDNPHRGKRKGAVSSLIRLGYYSCDYVIGYVLKVLPLRQRKHIVFFDRYFTDVIADSERSSIFLNYKFLAWLRHFIPGCQYNFLFRVDPERILGRKQELSREAIERIYSRLEYLVPRDQHYAWINNNGTPEEAVQQILNILLEQQNRSYVKKLS